MTDKPTDAITAPATKAASAIAASVGTSAFSLSQQAQSFLPHDLAGWLACGASAAALIYSVHLMAEWYWKKAVRPFCEARGWIKPLAHKTLVVDGTEIEVMSP